MSNIGTLSLTVKADTDSAAAGLGRLRGELTRVELSNKGAKMAIRELSETLGSQGGIVAGTVKAMLMMGPALGAAMAGLELYNHITQTASENAKANAENAASYAKVLKEIGQLTGTLEIPGIFTSDIAHVVDDINSKLAEMHKQFEKTSGDWFAGGAQLKQLTQDMAAFQNRQAEMLKLQRQLEPLNAAKENVDESSFNNAMKNKSGSYERILGDLHAQTQYVEELQAQLAQLPESGALYTKVLHEWRSASLRVAEAQQALFDKNDKAREAIAKNEEAYIKYQLEESQKAGEAAAQAAKKLSEEMKSVHDSLRTPLEEMEDRVVKLIDLWKNGLSENDFLRGVDKAELDFQKAQDKAKPAERLGQVKALDTSLIDIRGLKNITEQRVKDPQLEKTNQLLAQILQGHGAGSGAVAL